VPRDRGFGWWRGEPPVSFGAFGVRDTAGLDDYVAGQRASVGRLYSNYAAPVLALLQSDAFAPFLAAPTPDAAGAADLAERWAALGDVLARYEAKEPNSLSALESLILEDMGRAAPGSCAVGGGGRGSDWFAARARWLRDALLDRCRDLGAQWARQGYGQLRDAFNASLAGRFPFARDVDGAQDADPAEVRAFLELYDRLAAVRASVQSGRDGVGGAGSRAAAFLAQMDGAVAFLAPLVVADTGGGPAYRVAAEFRVDRAREVGADQVAEWSMQVGTMRLVPRDSAAASGAPWSPGEPVTLAFRWAAGSPVRPSAAGLPWGGRTDGTTLWYGYGGDWSLLRLMAVRAANPRERLGTTLSLPARTVAAPLHARAAVPGDAVPGDALLFVRVRVLDPATGRPLALPRFPFAAPALDPGDPS
jgi:type VI secretion system protein ImpL